MTTDSFIVLAVVTSPHGVSGRVKVKSFATPPDAFATDALQDEAGNPVRLKITSGVDTLYIVAIDGLKRREDAELWRGKKLGVPRTALIDMREEGEFYISDLVGATVEDEAGKHFGTVKATHNFGAGDIVEITKADGTEEMFSYTEATFPTVDVAGNRMVISPPDIITGEQHG